MKKKINVLIDMIGYGIVELPVDYSLSFYTKSGKDCVLAECHVDGINTAEHSWLCAKNFRLNFSNFDLGKGYTVCFGGIEVDINLYYQSMLNVVADYLALKEGFFYEYFVIQD
jgi:hypothetical protein